MKYINFLIVFVFASCASHINSNQDRQLSIIKQSSPEFYVEEKNPTTAMWLGLLPGGGSFYTRQYGYGAVNLLTWPLSVLWDPFNGEGGAKDLNYELTMMKIKKSKQEEMSKLEDEYMRKRINSEEFYLKSKRLETKYIFE
jgi:hypothetical protein